MCGGWERGSHRFSCRSPRKNKCSPRNFYRSPRKNCRSTCFSGRSLREWSGPWLRAYGAVVIQFRVGRSNVLSAGLTEKVGTAISCSRGIACVTPRQACVRRSFRVSGGGVVRFLQPRPYCSPVVPRGCFAGGGRPCSRRGRGLGLSVCCSFPLPASSERRSHAA